jgi:hypothetical protein
MKDFSIVQDFVQSLAAPAIRMDGRAPTAPGPSAPAPLAQAPADATHAPHAPELPPIPSVPVDFVGTAGEEFAQALAEINQLIRLTVANPRDLVATLSRCHFAVDGLRRKAMSMQQLTRLAHNRVRQSHEKLALHEVVASVLQERQSEHASAGFVVEPRYKSVDIIVDPGLLVSLISAALDWTCEFSTVLRVSTHMKDWPQHGVLSITAITSVHAQGEVIRRATSDESISWYVMQQIAQAMGVGVEVTSGEKDRSLAISFPRTVVALEGMTMMEMDTANSPLSGHSSFGAASSNFIAGHTVLLISSDSRVIARVREICRNLSLRLEHALSVEKAERACELNMPHLIMCEEVMADVRFEGLMDDLLRYSPGFPTVLLGEGDFGFEMSGWSGTGRSRVSKRDLETQLPTALTMELSRSI